MEPAVLLPHLKSATLQTLVINLGAAESGDLPSSCGRAIHAQVLEWFRRGDPKVSEAIHESQNSPLSLSGLISRCQKAKVLAGDDCYFRVGLLDGRLIEPLLKGLDETEDVSFSLAKFPFVLKGISALPGADAWVKTSDYALLAELPIVLNDLTLKFLSPTSFKLNTGQGIQLFPSPEAVFGNIHRRWNAFAPEELKFPKIQWSGLVSDYDLKTEKVRLENAVERGVIGWVRYLFPDPEQARVATILSHFAFFSGVGRKTAMGMGQVMLDE
ncbi:MAG: CRISPR-associated endoribonuclease Cas6 [Stenomitos rutilans HA7619-LM2]|jgi:CRISPR-associated endoribonuclease Cas6|nr:CRISPR-associated endoribonuclease Cas6 [Stenomitos rutilans HA7619-LM2]